MRRQKPSGREAACAPGEGEAGLGTLPVWNLGDLYESPESDCIDRDLNWLGGECDAFATEHEGRLASLSGDGLARAIRRYEAIVRRQHRLSLYAALRFQQNLSDPERGKFLADMQSRLTELTRPLVFFTLELNRLDEDVVEPWIRESGDLAHYRTWLRRTRAFRPHQLSSEIETYSHDLEPVTVAAWCRLFSETVTALEIEVDGESLSLERALNVFQETDRGRRQRAFTAVAQGLEANRRQFARITNTLVQSKEIDDRWRKLPTPRSARHLANDIEPEIVDALRDAVVEAYERIPHRYYALKSRWMGVERLESWDRIAPLPDQGDRIYSWSEAREIVEQAFCEFAPVMAEHAAPFFERGWIDAPASPGKAPGAFSAGGPSDVHPYILLNYQGRVRDVMTLAHELGHGVHQSLASRQGDLMSSAPLTFAETASVFGEMLVFRALLDRETDPGARRALLAGKAEDMINTVFRQISFYEFETRLHEERRSGELTSEEIGRIWCEVIGESLGPAVRLNDGFENFWCYVPHFVHQPFYVYAYAFGDALVNALYGVYRQDSLGGFEDRYVELLRAGGALRHPQLLAPFGLDLRDSSFWRIGLGLIEDTIDEAEAIRI